MTERCGGERTRGDKSHVIFVAATIFVMHNERIIHKAFRSSLKGIGAILKRREGRKNRKGREEQRREEKRGEMTKRRKIKRKRKNRRD